MEKLKYWVVFFTDDSSESCNIFYSYYVRAVSKEEAIKRVRKEEEDEDIEELDDYWQAEEIEILEG